MDTNKLKKYFHDPNENLIALLGQDYLTSLFVGELSRGVMFLTDKRVYQKGRIFIGGSSVKGETTCAVKDVMGTAFSEYKVHAFLVMGILIFILGLWPILGGLEDEDWALAGIGIGIILLFSLPSFILYFKHTTKIFMVQHAGGFMSVNARWYSENELHEFAKQISLLKEKIEQESRSR